MSESLSNTALADEAAVPSVEDTAPADTGEVVDGSAPQEGVDVVPAARFNGLMGKFNQTKAALKAAQTELESLRASQTSEVAPVASDEFQALQSQVTQLTELLTTERLDNARQKALDEYPRAKALADLIVADSPDGVREMARLIHERLESAGAPEAPATPAADAAPATGAPAAPATPEVPVVGGGTAFSGEASVADRVADAVKNRDFKAYLKAKTEALDAGLEG